MIGFIFYTLLVLFIAGLTWLMLSGTRDMFGLSKSKPRKVTPPENTPLSRLTWLQTEIGEVVSVSDWLEAGVAVESLVKEPYPGYEKYILGIAYQFAERGKQLVKTYEEERAVTAVVNNITAILHEQYAGSTVEDVGPTGAPAGLTKAAEILAWHRLNGVPMPPYVPPTGTDEDILNQARKEGRL